LSFTGLSLIPSLCSPPSLSPWCHCRELSTGARQRATLARRPLTCRVIHLFRIARNGNWILLSAGWIVGAITLVQTVDSLNLTYAFLLLMLGTLEQVNYYYLQLVRGDACGGNLNRRFSRPSLAKALSRCGSC
jgi:hypothetical protein